MINEFEVVKRLLWEEWDPIGINDDPDAFGEYDSYADKIQAMLNQGAGAEEIARYLSWVVTALIGLGADDQHSLAIAKKAVAVPLGHTSI